MCRGCVAKPPHPDHQTPSLLATPLIRDGLGETVHLANENVSDCHAEYRTGRTRLRSPSPFGNAPLPYPFLLVDDMHCRLNWLYGLSWSDSASMGFRWFDPTLSWQVRLGRLLAGPHLFQLRAAVNGGVVVARVHAKKPTSRLKRGISRSSKGCQIVVTCAHLRSTACRRRQPLAHTTLRYRLSTADARDKSTLRIFNRPR